MGFLVLCLLFQIASSAATMAAASSTKEEATPETRGPGFLYTRTPGRCTPQYWSSGREAWPNTVPEESAVSRVFGSRVLERYEPGMTLLEATQRNDDVGGSAFSKLIKQSSASLLNTYTRPGFPYNSWEVKTLLLEALISEDAAASQAEEFARANNACT